MLLALDEAGLVNPRAAALLDARWDTAWAALRRFDIATCAAACGIDESVIRDLAARLGGDEPAAVYGRMGVSTAEFGSLNHWLIQLLNIATGNFDRVGGVAVQPARRRYRRHRRCRQLCRFRSRVSGHPEVLSEFPVVALAEEILTPGAGQIDMLFVIAGNPVLSTPDGTNLDRALARLKLMVSVDMYHRHLRPRALHPAAVRAAREGPLPDLPRANHGAQFRRLFARGVRSDAGHQIGLGNPRRTDARGGAGTRCGGTQHHAPARSARPAAAAQPRGLSLADIEKHPHGPTSGPLQPTGTGKLATADKKIDAAPPLLIADLDRFADWLAALPALGGDVLLLFGRRNVRSNNSWMGNSRRLAKGPARCVLMINPADAAPRRLASGDMVDIASRVGSVRVACEISDDVMPGTVSLPHGYGHDRPGIRLRVAERPGVSYNDLSDPLRIDAVSGNAALSGVPVSVIATPSMVAAQ